MDKVLLNSISEINIWKTILENRNIKRTGKFGGTFQQKKSLFNNKSKHSWTEGFFIHKVLLLTGH